MKKTTISFILFIIFAYVCSAKTSVWKISKDGKTLYLGGSIHMLRAEDYPLPDAFDKAFSFSDRIVFETDIDQMANPEVSNSILLKSMLQEGQTLKNMLNDITYRQLEEACNSFNLSIDELQQLKPAILVTFLTVAKIQQMGFAPQGIDHHYFEKAKASGKELDYLETVESQINLLTNMGIGYENEFVTYSLEDIEHIEDQMNTLVKEWRNGTSSEMESQLSEMKTRFPSVYKSMVTNRNNDWMPQLTGYLSGEKISFVIVGLAHMYGEDGLLRQLQEKGYAIEQME